MHSSTAGLRPRQRTFTSCTECRRRKQKCNQAKDRPCSNCARRYPPPVCTYQDSSPTTPPLDHVVDFRDSDRDDMRSSQPSRSSVPSNSSLVTSSPYSGQYVAMSPIQNAYNTQHDYQSPSPTNNRYYPNDVSSSHQITGSSSGGYEAYPAAGGYYQSNHLSYTSSEVSPDYSYCAPDDHWLTNGNPNLFAGPGTGQEYFYVDDSDPTRPAASRA